MNWLPSQGCLQLLPHLWNHQCILIATSLEPEAQDQEKWRDLAKTKEEEKNKMVRKRAETETRRWKTKVQEGEFEKCTMVLEIEIVPEGVEEEQKEERGKVGGRGGDREDNRWEGQGGRKEEEKRGAGGKCGTDVGTTRKRDETVKKRERVKREEIKWAWGKED